MKKQVNVFVSILLLSIVSYAGGGSVGSNACCIQSTLDKQNNIDHSGKSNYCVSNNSQEMPEVSANVFEIEKYGYTFKIDLNQAREQSISITKPDGKVQTEAEKPGMLTDLFIGTFGVPKYQYISENALGFSIDCGQK